MKRNGFTLIEILVALFVFAILATITTIGLRRLINVNHLIDQKVRQLQQLQISMTLLQRNILQLVDRPILDVDGSKLSALETSDNNLEFTAANHIDPALLTTNTQQQAKSALQRVRYSIIKGNLVRTIWPVLDRATNTKPLNRILMNGATSMVVQFINHKGDTVNSWALGSNGPNDRPNYPNAIIVRLKIKGLGSVLRVFYLPQGDTHAP